MTPEEVSALTARLESPTVGYPDDLPPRHNASHEPCDMLYGPCICGAWHCPEDTDTDRKEAASALRTLLAEKQALERENKELKVIRMTLRAVAQNIAPSQSYDGDFMRTRLFSVLGETDG